MKWLEITINTAHSGVNLLGDALDEAGYGGFAVEDEEEIAGFIESDRLLWREPDEGFAAPAHGECHITLHLPDNGDGNALLSSLPALFDTLRSDWPAMDFGDLGFTVATKDEEDWANSWRRFYKPFPVGERVYIRPEWEDAGDVGGRIIFDIDPGMAFGSGDHATTRLCVCALEKLVKGGEAVLDVGCGSGILSVISVLLGVSSALGADIDAYAVKVAEGNAERNGVSDKCKFVGGDALDENFMIDAPPDGFDIAVANIVADVVIPLASRAFALLKSGGFFVASGVIDKREGDVRGALDAAGFAVRDVAEDSGWVCFVAEKE